MATTQPEKKLWHTEAFLDACWEEVPWGTGAVKQVNTRQQEVLIACLYERIQHGWSTSFIAVSDQIDKENTNNRNNENPKIDNNTTKTLI